MRDKELLLKNFGRHLRKMRKVQGMSIRDFELESELNRHSLSKIENGKWNPSLYTLKKICERLNVDLSDLFKDFKG